MKTISAGYSRLFFWGFTCWAALIAAAYLMRPITDPDFFWHLKTGQWIWQHQSLPHHDHYGVAPPATLDSRASFILSSYWLCQLWYWFWYSVAGWRGIFIARIMLALAAATVIWRFVRLTTVTHSAIVLLGVVQIAEAYQLDRPQILSFFFFGTLIVLLTGIISTRHPIVTSSVLVIAVMMLWANCHGGYSIGLLLLLTVLAGEALKFVHPALEPMPKNRYLYLVGISLIAFAASHLNPNSIRSYAVWFSLGQDHAASHYMRLKEYASAYHSLTVLKGYTVIVNWLVMALCTFTIAGNRKIPDITWLLLLAGTALAGNLHVRYMPFFVVTSTLYLLKQCSEYQLHSALKSVCIAVALLGSVLLCQDDFGNFLQRYRYGSKPDPYYPEKAADYLISTKTSGSLLNLYGWGGYLIWRLGEQHKIFCDGRQLDLDRFQLCTAMYDTTDINYWNNVARTYQIKTVLLPAYLKGKPFALTQAFANSPDWSLVYSVDNSAVFVPAQLQK